MTAGELHDALARLGADLMVRALGALERGTLQFTPQPATGVTYAAKIDKAETRIDWGKPWQTVHDHIRGLSPFPGAWCEIAERRAGVSRCCARPGARAAARPARCSTTGSPSPAAMARCASSNCSAPAAADEGGRNSCAARRSPTGARELAATADHAALQAHHRI